MATCTKAKLLKRYGPIYRLSHRLQDVYDFQEIRLENPVRMHANEAAPLPYVRRAIEKALDGVNGLAPQELARHLFDDQLRDYYGQRSRWGKKAPGSLVGATEAHAPYLLVPAKPAKTGVLLVHGFGTTPAELKAFGEDLHARGHAVLGMRLPGHGTSWFDMETRGHGEWLAAVRENISIISAFCEHVVVVGFSTGGALSLLAAAEPQAKLAGVATVAAPVFVTDKNMTYLKYIAAPLRLLHRLPGLGRTARLYPYGMQTPDMTYKLVPVEGINQLRLLITKVLKNLGKVTVPVMVVQGLNDKTVVPRSAAAIYSHLGSETKELKWIAGGPHNLITGNYGPTWELLRGWIKTCGTHAKSAGKHVKTAGGKVE
jgi:esterase/lipase